MVTSILQWIGGYIRGVCYTPASGLMLNEKELAFIKAICTLKLSPTFLRDLRKGVAAKKRKPLRPARPRQQEWCQHQAPFHRFRSGKKEKR